MTDPRPNSPCLVALDQVRPVDVRWLWKDRVPKGALTMLVGVPGCGKSFLALDLAARLSNGVNWPDAMPNGRTGKTLLLMAEDALDATIAPRLDASGADRSMVVAMRGVNRYHNGKIVEAGFTLIDIDVLERAIEEVGGIDLMVIDPVNDYLGPRTNGNDDIQIRSVLQPLGRLAHRHDFACVCIHHSRKGDAIHADDVLLGARAYSGLARAIWHVMHDPDDQDRRLLLAGKMNIAKPSPGMAFTIGGDPGVVQWALDLVTETASEVMRRTRETPRESPALDEAIEFIESMLADGPKPQKRIEAAAEERGISIKTMRRAKKSLG
ncbi:MAG: AAA family ATPase, partial [Planctomycetota bacterium]